MGAGPRQRAPGRWERRREARAPRAGAARPRHARGGSRASLRGGPAERRRHGGDPGGGARARGRPARRRGRPLLGADQRGLRPRHRDRQPGGRSDLLVHDGGPRRGDPHGLLQSVCDGAPGRAEGPLPRGLRERPGRRPPRDRHPLCGPAGTQPLPRGGHPLPADPPAGLAGAGGGGKDAGLERADRPGGGRPRPPSVGGPGGLQVVRPGALGRHLLLRRRGERRRELPAPGRERLDHRQGRADPEPARRRDHRAHGPRPGRALPRARGAARDALLPADRCARDSRAEGEAREALARRRPRDEARGPRDHGPAHPGARQRRPDRRAQGRRRRQAGSRRGPPAPRTSTRSTRRASRGPRTSMRSCGRRGGS